MQKPRTLRSKNSTIVRSFLFKATGKAISLVGAVRPALADRWSTDLFCKTTRRPGLRDPGADGLAGHRFELNVNGRRIAAWDFGSGPTVLLAHGWNGDAAQMRAMIGPLVAAGHSVVAFDQPAHGRSSGHTANLRDFADATLAIGRRVGPVRAVIGHSLGGLAAASALARGLKADRAVLLAPAGDPREYLQRFALALGLPPLRNAGLVDELVRRAGPLEHFEPQVLAANLTAKALIIHDPGDREVPFSHGQAFAAAWPGARLRSAPGLGHTRLLADPQIVREVTAFVAGDEGAALAMSA